MSEEDDQARVARAIQQVDDMEQALVDKGKLLLHVTVKTKEEAAEIYRWMYQKADPPMKSELTCVSWDQQLVSSNTVEALRQLADKLEFETQQYVQERQ